MADIPPWAIGLDPIENDPGFVRCPNCGATAVLPSRDGGVGTKPVHSPGCKLDTKAPRKET